MKDAEHMLASKAADLEVDRLLLMIMDRSYTMGVDLEERASSFEMETLADLGFLFREMGKKLDEMRKECDRKQKLIGKLLCLRITKNNLSGSGKDRVDGELCTATPDIKMRPNLPQKGSPEWTALMDALGVPEETRDNKLVQFHWNHISEWLTRLTAEGRRPPQQLTILRPEPACTYRRKKKREK